MKKFALTLLIVGFGIPGCAKKKNKIVQPDKQTIVKNNYEKRKGTKTFSEDAEEFILEDDAEFNVFESENGAQPDSFSWEELDESEDEQVEIVQFDYDSTKIKDSERQKIQRNSKVIQEHLKGNDKAKVAVRGHSCKIAKNKDYNYAISQERAEKLKKAYEERGVPAEKVKAVGYGSSVLLTDKDGVDAQAVNRRAETVFLG